MAELMLEDALENLRDCLAKVRLPLPLPDVDEQKESAARLSAQLDDYVIPRIKNITAPLLAVVGGSTGAGKSTLVNSLIGRLVTPTGVIRPTTKSPVLVFNPDDEHWFADERVLPGLVRSRVASQDHQTLHLVPEPTLPPGLAILDAPDIDSVVDENRQLAAVLLDAADLWLFVTSAARYSDAVPWEFLQQVSDRGGAVAVVLDRVAADAMRVIPADLGRMMSERGLAEAPLFAVPETLVDHEGLLPDVAVAPIRAFLAQLAADNQRRLHVVLKTLTGVINQLLDKAPQIADALDLQSATLEQLQIDADKSFAEAVRAIAVQSADGTLLKGEVLSRWHDFVGASDISRKLDHTVGRLRDRITQFFKGEPSPGRDVAIAAGSGLEALIIEECAASAERATNAWAINPAGRQILAHHPDLSKLSPDFAQRASQTIRDWQTDVLEVVEAEGVSKRNSARLAAFGVNGAGAALMLVIFASTGGLTGLEGGVALGTSALAQKILESIFGDDAVRRLTKSAKDALDARVQGLVSSELLKFKQVLDNYLVDKDQANDIRNAVADVRQARDHTLDELEAGVSNSVQAKTITDPPTSLEGSVDGGERL